MDLTQSIEPKSDQLNAEDLLAGAQTFTIERVSAGSADQPVNVELVERPGRPYRPSKSMRRILVAAWGKDASVYAGRKLTLYRDPDVKFGGIAVGGIKISHMSHIDKPLKVALTVTRGKRQATTVQPLKESAPTSSGITQQRWEAIKAAAVAQGVEDLQGWLSDHLGRTVNRWQEITAAEGDALEKVLTTGEVQS